MTQVIIPANATEAEEDAILGAAVEAREGQQRTRVNIEDLDGKIGRGQTEHVLHADEFGLLPRSMGKSVTIEPNAETVAALQDTSTGETYKNAEELFAEIEDEAEGDVSYALASDDESFALPGDDPAPVKVGLIGNQPSGAAALINAGLAARKVEQPKSGNLPNRAFMTNTERKRRAAAEHNARIKPNTYLIVKFRTQGLKLRLQLQQMTQRAIIASKDCGNFAIYSPNLAVSMPRLKLLPAAQNMKRSMHNQETLDWVLDQLGETIAFEIRSNRLHESTPMEFFIEKTEAEWVAKGFQVKNGNVIFA